MNTLADILLSTLRSLRAHALRFTLTSLGIVWGIAMLTYLTASNDGFDRHFHERISNIGERIVFVFSGSVLKDRVGARSAREIEFEVEDIDRISNLQAVEAVASIVWLETRVFRAGRRTKLVWTFGGSERTAEIRNIGVAQGRFISKRDVEESAKVVFLGAKAAERLFGDAPALGRTVRIDSIPFRVIGVAEPKGSQIIYVGPADDDQATIPVTTAQRWFTKNDSVHEVIFAPVSREVSWNATEYVRGVLGLHHDFRPDQDTALFIFNIQEAIQIIETLGLGLRIFLLSASMITLMVGAVGVMNIMLVVVTERTKEIGVRKAIGASDRDIFVEFLAESVAVSFMSGIVGAALGWLAVQLAIANAVASSNQMTPVPVVLPSMFVLVFFSIVGVGLAAGILPALRASRIEPAISLRSV